MVDFRKMFPDVIWSEYVQGFVIALRSTGTMDVKIAEGYRFRITDMKEMGWLADEREALLRNLSKKRIAMIDKYFDAGDEE